MNAGKIEGIGKELEGENLQFVSLEKECEDNCEEKNKNPPQVPKLSYYRQNYCGCVYSLKERYEEKFAQPSQDIDVL